MVAIRLGYGYCTVNVRAAFLDIFAAFPLRTNVSYGFLRLVCGQCAVFHGVIRLSYGLIRLAWGCHTVNLTAQDRREFLNSSKTPRSRCGHVNPYGFFHGCRAVSQGPNTVSCGQVRFGKNDRPQATVSSKSVGVSPVLGFTDNLLAICKKLQETVCV